MLDLDLRRGRCTDKERAMTGIAKSPRRDRRGRPKRGGTHQARYGECSSQRNAPWGHEVSSQSTFCLPAN